MKNQASNFPKKFIAFDLSGSGTTAWFDGKAFGSYFSKNWEDHISYIQGIMKKHPGWCILYERLTKIRRNNKTSKDLVDISKVIGVIEYKYKYKYTTLSFMTKDFRSKIMTGKKKFPLVTYQRGFYWNDQKLSDHEIDAVIIFYYGRAKVTGEWI